MDETKPPRIKAHIAAHPMNSKVEVNGKLLEVTSLSLHADATSAPTIIMTVMLREDDVIEVDGDCYLFAPHFFRPRELVIDGLMVEVERPQDGPLISLRRRSD